MHNWLFIDKGVIDTLYKPFHFDKRRKLKDDEHQTIYAPIFTFKKSELIFRYLRDYIDSGHEKVEQPLTQDQKEALALLDNILEDKSIQFRFTLKAGQIYFANNHRIIHGRTSFEDYKELEKRRLMERVWLHKA